MHYDLEPVVRIEKDFSSKAKHLNAGTLGASLGTHHPQVSGGILFSTSWKGGGLLLPDCSAILPTMANIERFSRIILFYFLNLFLALSASIPYLLNNLTYEFNNHPRWNAVAEPSQNPDSDVHICNEAELGRYTVNTGKPLLAEPATLGYRSCTDAKRMCLSAWADVKRAVV